MAGSSIFLVCASCNKTNKLTVDNIGQHAKCGHCKSDLDIKGGYANEPLELSDSDFETLIKSVDAPVLVDFWAPWCGPCRAVAPILAEIAQEHAKRIIIGKINTDKHQRIAAHYNITGIPTMLLFKQGKHLDTLIGALPKHVLLQKLQPYLA